MRRRGLFYRKIEKCPANSVLPEAAGVLTSILDTPYSVDTVSPTRILSNFNQPLPQVVLTNHNFRATFASDPLMGHNDI